MELDIQYIIHFIRIVSGVAEVFRTRKLGNTTEIEKLGGDTTYHRMILQKRILGKSGKRLQSYQSF